MIVNYVRKRWFLLGAMAGILLAVQVPGPTRQVFSSIDTRSVACTALFFMSISLATSRLWEALRRPGPVTLALAITWGLAPIVGWLVAPWTLPEKYHEGLLIACAVPCTLASAAVWTGMGGGNQAIALMMTMITNSFVFIGTAGWLSLLTGQDVEFDTLRMVRELVVFVVVPIIAAQLIRGIPAIGQFIDRQKTPIGVFCRLCILTIIIKSAVQTNAALAERANQGLGREGWAAMELVAVALVCAGIHTFLLLVGYFVAKPMFGHADATAVAIAGSQKTLPVAALVASDFFPGAPLAIVPILFYHVIQLMIDTYFVEMIAPPPAQQSDREPGPAGDDLVTS